MCFGRWQKGRPRFLDSLVMSRSVNRSRPPSLQRGVTLARQPHQLRFPKNKRGLAATKIWHVQAVTILPRKHQGTASEVGLFWPLNDKGAGSEQCRNVSVYFHCDCHIILFLNEIWSSNLNRLLAVVVSSSQRIDQATSPTVPQQAALPLTEVCGMTPWPSAYVPKYILEPNPHPPLESKLNQLFSLVAELAGSGLHFLTHKAPRGKRQKWGKTDASNESYPPQN